MSAPGGAPKVQAALIERWCAEKLAKGYQRDSVMTARKWVLLATAEGIDLAACDRRTIMAWLDRHDWSDSTRRYVVEPALRGHLKWLIEHGHRTSDPMRKPPKDRNHELIEEYLTWCAAAGHTPRTTDTKLSYLKRFAEHFGELEQATTSDLAAWVAAHPRWKPATRKSAVGALRTLYAWMYDHGHIPEDPARRLGSVRVPPPDTIIVPDATYLAAMGRAQDREDRLMLQLGRLAGLRRAEIAAVHSRHIVGLDLIVHGKGGRTRHIPLPPDLAAEIRSADGWLFPSPRLPGEHIGGDVVGRRFRRLLGHGYTGHKLRHAFATTAYRGTQDVLTLQQLLGHASADTTARYVHLDPATLAAVAAAARAGLADDSAPTLHSIQGGRA